MKYDDRYIIELSRAAIFDDIPFEPEKNIDWNYIYKKSVDQNIVGLIAFAILKLPKDIRPSNMDKWQLSMLQTINVMTKKNIEFLRILDELNKNLIFPLCLKGVVVKNYYPVPELRTMGDFDILIEKNERLKCEMVFKKMGYTLKRDTLFFEIDKDFIHGEVFFSLEDDFRKDPIYWDIKLKSNIITDLQKKTLKPTYELAYSIVHASKHFTREGCGIRNLLDIVLMLKSNASKIDFNIVENICKSQSYEKIYYYMISAARIFYDIRISVDMKKINKNLLQDFVEYLLQYGIFGRPTDGNVLSQQVVRRERGNSSTLQRIFFPPKEMIWHKYQYLKRNKFLLPIAWIHRFIVAVFIKKYSVALMIKGIKKSMEYGNEHDIWLNRLGLK